MLFLKSIWGFSFNCVMIWFVCVFLVFMGLGIFMLFVKVEELFEFFVVFLVNNFWFLVVIILVIFMNVGFVMVEVGMCW